MRFLPAQSQAMVHTNSWMILPRTVKAKVARLNSVDDEANGDGVLDLSWEA